MKVLSLFSGVGGFDLGLENAGMETVFQCEWDKHATPRKVNKLRLRLRGSGSNFPFYSTVFELVEGW